MSKRIKQSDQHAKGPRELPTLFVPVLEPHPDTLILDWLERQLHHPETWPGLLKWVRLIQGRNTDKLDLRAKVLAEMAREKKEQDRG